MQTLPLDCLPLFNRPFVFRTEAGICIYYPITSCCHKRIPLLYTSCLARLSLYLPFSRNPILSFCIYSTRPHLRCVTFPSSVFRPPRFHMYSFIQQVFHTFPSLISSSPWSYRHPIPPLLYSPPLCGHLCTIISTLVSFISAYPCAIC